MYYGYKTGILVKGTYTDLQAENVTPYTILEMTRSLLGNGFSYPEVKNILADAVSFPLQYNEEGRLLSAYEQK